MPCCPASSGCRGLSCCPLAFARYGKDCRAHWTAKSSKRAICLACRWGCHPSPHEPLDGKMVPLPEYSIFVPTTSEPVGLHLACVTIGVPEFCQSMQTTVVEVSTSTGWKWLTLPSPSSQEVTGPERLIRWPVIWFPWGETLLSSSVLREEGPEDSYIYNCSYDSLVEGLGGISLHSHIRPASPRRQRQFWGGAGDLPRRMPQLTCCQNMKTGPKAALKLEMCCNYYYCFHKYPGRWRYPKRNGLVLLFVYLFLDCSHHWFIFNFFKKRKEKYSTKSFSTHRKIQRNQFN